jgi:hypothetical protein
MIGVIDCDTKQIYSITNRRPRSSRSKQLGKLTSSYGYNSYNREDNNNNKSSLPSIWKLYYWTGQINVDSGQ